MDNLARTLLALSVGVVAAAAMPLVRPSPDLCFTAGAVTYRLTSDAASADIRVAVDNAAARPDLRIRLVDRVEASDFALTDDAGAGNACKAGGLIRTVGTVPPGAPADIVIAMSRAGAASDFALYVHSVRIGHHDAAALFAAIRQAPDRAPDGGHVAALR